MSFNRNDLPPHDEYLPPGVSEAQISGPESDGGSDTQMSDSERDNREREMEEGEILDRHDLCE